MTRTASYVCLSGKKLLVLHSQGLYRLPHLHRNIEAYMDDIVVKTRDNSTFIQDLEETFANLRKINLKVNPEKCMFGVPSGKLVGFFVSQRVIEANPEKIKAIEQR